MTTNEIGIFLCAGVAVGGLCRWWLKPGKKLPNPWGPDVEQLLDDPDLPELCHRCLLPHESSGWFCSHCGAAVGKYNNYMPFVHIFSEGEVFRTGTTSQFRRSPLTVGGYVFFSITAYGFFAPIYWYRLFRNLKQPSPASPPENPAESAP